MFKVFWYLMMLDRGLQFLVKGQLFDVIGLLRS